MEHSDDKLVSEAEFLRNPDRWPRWPLLPVKRSFRENPNIGVVAHLKVPGHLTELFFYPGQNIYEFDADGRFEPIKDVDEFVKKGWKVD